MERARQLAERFEMTSARLAAAEARADEAWSRVARLLEGPGVAAQRRGWWSRLTGKN